MNGRDRSVLRIVGLATALFLTSGRTHAKDLNLQGRIGLGAGSIEGDEVEDLFELRLGVKTKRKEGVRAYVEVRADEDGREVTVNDAFVDWRNESKSSRIRGGRGKQILGWEYDYPTSDRLSIGRTALYDFLASRQLVGRDYFVGYDWTSLRTVEIDEEEDESEKTRSSDLDSSVGNPTFLIDPAERWRLGASFHYDESRNSAIILSVIAVPSSRWRIGAWVEFHYTRGQQGAQSVDSFETMLSALMQIDGHRAAAELFLGDDPYRTQVEKYYGGGRNVRTAGVKLEYGAYFGAFNPYLIATILWTDLKYYGDRTHQEIAGLRSYLTEAFSIAGELQYLKSFSAHDATSESRDRETFLLIARYFF